MAESAERESDDAVTLVPIFDRCYKVWYWFATDSLRVKGDRVTGVVYREDGPAIKYANGTRAWFIRGQRHRKNGPAIERIDGSRTWYVRGQRHREDGPAIEHTDGSREWWIRGRLHRKDGPAVELANGMREWWDHGRWFKDEEAWRRARGAKR